MLSITTPVGDCPMPTVWAAIYASSFTLRVKERIDSLDPDSPGHVELVDFIFKDQAKASCEYANLVVRHLVEAKSGGFTFEQVLAGSVGRAATSEGGPR